MRANLVAAALVLTALAMGGCMQARFAAESPTPTGPVATMDEVMMLITAGRYDEAAAKLTPMIARYEHDGQSDAAAKATFWQGYCCEKQGRTGEAGRLYTRVVKTYPDTAAARQASERLALLQSDSAPR
jgi:TolA-binding protein